MMKKWMYLGFIIMTCMLLLGGMYGGMHGNRFYGMEAESIEHESTEEEVTYPRIIEEKEDYNRVEVSEGQIVAVFHHEQGIEENVVGIESGALNRDSVVGHNGRLGTVSGNGTTIVNDLYAPSGIAFCAQRWSDPVSYAAHFNNGVVDTSKMTWAIAAGLDNKFGDMSGQATAVRKVVSQAALWYFEGTLPRSASVSADGYGDVSGLYRKVIDSVELQYNKSNKLAFNKSKVTSSFDEKTKTIKTEVFKVTDDSVSGDLKFTINAPFFVTKKDDIVPLKTLKSGQEIVVRTYELNSHADVGLEVMSEKYEIQGKRYAHPSYPELQNLLSITKDEKKSFSARIIAEIRPVLGSYQLVKKIDQTQVNNEGTLKIDALEMERKLVVEITGNGIETQTPTFHYNKEKQQFETDVFKVAPGTYAMEEKSAPDMLLLEKGKKSFVVRPNELTHESVTTITDRVKLGELKISKKITQQTTDQDVVLPPNLLYKEITINVTSLNPYYVFSKDYILSEKGEIVIKNLPFGSYLVKEVAAPDDVEMDAKEYVVVITDDGKSKTPFELDVKVTKEVSIDNKVKRGKVRIEKQMIDKSKEGLPCEKWGLDKIQIEVKGNNVFLPYRKVLNLSKEGAVEFKKLPIGRYEVREIAVPDHMEKDETVHVFDLVRDGQAEQFSYTNVLPDAAVEIEKVNTNGDYVSGVQFKVGTELLQTIDGKLRVFQEVTGEIKEVLDGRSPDAKNGLFHRIDPKSYILGTYTTQAPTGKVQITGIPFGYKTVYIEEVKVPTQGNHILNRQPKKVTLKKDDIVKVKFVNKIKVPGIIEVMKRDEDGQFIAMHFELYQKMGNTQQYVETISTSTLDGIGRSTVLDIFDAEDNPIQYFLQEQKSELFIPVKPIEIHAATWNPNTSSYRVEVTNYYKKISASLWKTVAENDMKLTAKGITFEWYNKKNEFLGTFAFQGNGESILKQKVDIRQLLDGKGTYIVEKSVGNGIVKDATKIIIPPIDLSKLSDGDIIPLNAKQTMIVNEPTETYLLKKNIDKNIFSIGNTLAIYDNKTLIKRWESTDKTEVIKGLTIGKTYKWCEEVIIEGMAIPQMPCQFIKIKENKESFEMENKPTEVIVNKYAEEIADDRRQEGNLFQIRLHKKRQNLHEETMPKISSIHKVYADEITQKVIEGNEGEIIVQFKSLRDGPNIVRYLPIGYSYILEEVEAVDGFSVAQSITFEMPSSGQISFDVVNDRILVKTGEYENERTLLLGILLFIDGILLVVWNSRRKRKKMQYEKMLAEIVDEDMI